MNAVTSYYSLLERDDPNSPWGVAFGDYDRVVVEQELRDQRDYGVRRNCLKIIVTDEDQVSIQNAVDMLNKGG